MPEGSPGYLSPAMRAARFKRFRGGFSLVEVVIVILIIGILAAIAAPSVFTTVDDARASAELRNARSFFAAVQQFEAINGKLPNDAGPGGFPSDLDGYVSRSLFSTSSPAGGQYDWDGPPPHSVPRFKLRLSAGTVASTEPFYVQMETIADDGSPATGWITASGQMISFWY